MSDDNIDCRLLVIRDALIEEKVDVALTLMRELVTGLSTMRMLEALTQKIMADTGDRATIDIRVASVSALGYVASEISSRPLPIVTVIDGRLQANISPTVHVSAPTIIAQPIDRTAPPPRRDDAERRRDLFRQAFQPNDRARAAARRGD